MIGVLVKTTTNKLPNITKNKVIHDLKPDTLKEIKDLKSKVDKNIAVIGVLEAGKKRLVALTAYVTSITSNGQGISLHYVKALPSDECVWTLKHVKTISLHYVKALPQHDRWTLPRGYADSKTFEEHGYEFIYSEPDVLSCLVKSPAALLSDKGPKMPSGFKWNPAVASNLVITFDQMGKAVLHSRPAFNSEVLGCFDSYMESLNQVWEKMNGYVFEGIMQELFESLGFKVIASKRGGDGGVDLMLFRADGILGEDKYIVQCKRWHSRHKVGNDVVILTQGAPATTAHSGP